MQATAELFPRQPEPWLRGLKTDVHPLISPLFFSFLQVREDLNGHVAGLDERQLWKLFGKASIGFHLKHIAGSVDRLGTYLAGGQLSESELSFLRAERDSSGSAGELLALVDASLAACEARLRELDPAEIFSTRSVGSEHLPTTVIGLLIHLAEHTQRHLGQAITLSQVVRQSS